MNILFNCLYSFPLLLRFLLALELLIFCKFEIDNKYRFEFLPICMRFVLEFGDHLKSILLKFYLFSAAFAIALNFMIFRHQCDADACVVQR